MDFTFSPEHIALRQMLREFCEAELRPRAKEVDRTGQQEPEVLRQMGELGMFGVPFPQKYGGMGAGETGYCILMEELNRVSPSFATVVGAHIGIAAMSIYLDGTEEQKQKYLVPMARGEQIGAFA